MSLTSGFQSNRGIYQKRQFENNANCELNESYEHSIYNGTSTLVRKVPRYDFQLMETQNEVAKPTPHFFLAPTHNFSTKFWRKGSLLPNIAPFTKYIVPDLVILEIFSHLTKQELCNAMRACRRFYLVGNIAKNWRTLDMSDKQITSEALISVMRRNVQVMRISDAKMLGTSSLPHSFSLNSCAMESTSSSRLMYLDVSRAAIDHHLLLMLLKPCVKLVCLSVEGQTINDEISECISRNTSLTRLDLSMSKGITPDGVYRISKNCTALEELNLSWCGVTSACCEILTKTLTRRIRKLNLSGTTRDDGLLDIYMANLADSCPNLVDLDVSDNVDLSKKSVVIIDTRMPNLRTLSCNRCYGIDPNIFINLNNGRLRVLNVHGCIAETTLDYFKNMCSPLLVNRDIFNFTAKPSTSTSAKTSYIWGKPLEP